MYISPARGCLANLVRAGTWNTMTGRSQSPDMEHGNHVCKDTLVRYVKTMECPQNKQHLILSPQTQSRTCSHSHQSSHCQPPCCLLRVEIPRRGNGWSQHRQCKQHWMIIATRGRYCSQKVNISQHDLCIWAEVYISLYYSVSNVVWSVYMSDRWKTHCPPPSFPWATVSKYYHQTFCVQLINSRWLWQFVFRSCGPHSLRTSTS